MQTGSWGCVIGHENNKEELSPLNFQSRHPSCRGLYRSVTTPIAVTPFNLKGSKFGALVGKLWLCLQFYNGWNTLSCLPCLLCLPYQKDFTSGLEGECRKEAFHVAVQAGFYFEGCFKKKNVTYVESVVFKKKKKFKKYHAWLISSLLADPKTTQHSSQIYILWAFVCFAITLESIL